MKITHIDYSILGLLANSDFSGYQIRMVFEKTAMGNFSSSPGTIYPALTRLQKHRLIVKRPSPHKSGELYAITKQGLKTLKSWVLQPVTQHDIARGLDTLVLRIAFLDLADNHKNRRRFLASVHDALQTYIDELELFHKKESAGMPMGGRLAFEHGIASYKSTLKWIVKVQSAYAGKK